MVETEQNKYLIIFEKAPAPYFILTTDGYITDINTAGAELLGENKLYLLYTPFINFIKTESKERFREFLQSLSAGENGYRGRRSAVTDLQIVTMNGKPLDVRLEGNNAEGRGVPVVYLAVSDVTHYKETIRNLSAEVKEKETVTQEMNHRIKNNLNLITGIINLQKLEEEDERLAAKLEDMESRINAVGLVHERILPAASVDTIDAAVYMSRLMDALFAMYNEDDVDLITDIDEIVFPMKKLVNLGLIVSELVTNALKHGFTGAEKKKLTIALKKESTGYVLRVRNNGAPIPKEVNMDNPGSLGFSLVRTLVGQLGGEIEINRKKSTEFIITFPAEQVSIS